MNNRQEYIQSVINELSSKELKRLRKIAKDQTHEYIYFNVSIFNVGAVVTFRQTNKFIDKNIDDGYSFYLLQAELELFNLEN